MKSVNVKARAKLNTFLDILGKRPDGYHEVLTAMCAIDLADDVTVSIEDGDGIDVTCSDPTITENTAYKAAELFLRKAGIRKRISIDIVKRIPVMAGLGGSSADAAAVLHALNALAGEPFRLEQLLELGAEVGADVPFCVHGGHALCTGTGATVSEVLPPLDCAFVIVKPEFGCCTKTAYTQYGIKPIPKTEFRYYYNVFEKLHNNPEICRIKADLMNAGATASCLTGSGSAVYGVFGDREAAQKAFRALTYKEKYIAQPTT